MRPIPLRLALICLALPVQAREVSGNVTLRERLALPADTVVSIEAVAPDGIVTRQSRAPGASQPPYAFALDAPDAPLTLTARIEAGGRIWTTDPTRIPPGESTDMGFLLATATEGTSTSDLLACSDALLQLQFTGDLAILARGRDTHRLDRTPDGTFSDNASPETTLRAATAISHIIWEGEDLPPCIPFPDPATAPLTAQGNEPGWALTLGPEGAQLEGQDGTVITSAALPRLLTGDELRLFPPGFPDIALSPGLCTDTMTGMPYPVAVRLETADDWLDGCGGDPATLLGGDWTVTWLDERPVPDGTAPTLAFSGGQVSGNAGCNRYSGPATLTAEGLHVGPLAATRMACSAPRMEGERAFLDALSTVDRFDIDPGGDLLLLGTDRTLLRAHR